MLSNEGAEISPAAEAPERSGLTRREVKGVLFVALSAATVWLLQREVSLYADAIGIACTLLAGFPIFREAYQNLIQRRMTMELSMAIAIAASLLIREVFTALIITLFVLVAEILERLTVSRGRQGIERLLHFLPNEVTLRQHGEWTEVEVGKVSVDDELLVRPGARVPVDGTVVRGHSFVNEAAITGEPIPVEKRTGAPVFAGTINQAGALEVRVTRVGQDTTFGKIIEAVERAEKLRAPIQGLADQLSGYLVYFALVAAALTFLATHNMRSTISVIVVAGACGIAAGTPLAILGAIGRAAHDGAIIKGGLYLEQLSEVNTVVFDKTGTLTYGTPEVVQILPASGVSPAFLLETAAIAEFQSEHPVAKAILSKASRMGIDIPRAERFEYTPGRGVVAEFGGEEIVVGNWLHLREERIQGAGAMHGTSDGAVLVTRGTRLLGSIHIADMLRPEAKTAVSKLKEMGLKTILLTGDSNTVAQAIGKGLGVDEIFGEQSPQQKLDRIEELLTRGNKVVMVGDGINDAPALTRATVGVAMGSGTDIAQETSDVVLIGSDLTKFAETIRTARRCRRTIMQNFAGTLLVDGFGVALAAFGYLSPLLAAFIHVSSEMIFILNSARLLPQLSTGVQSKIS